ncbi:hypothetical protein [Nocardia asteroides]
MADGGGAQVPGAGVLPIFGIVPTTITGQQQLTGAEKQEERLSHGGTDPVYVPEGVFETFIKVPHQELYDAVQAMQPGVMQQFGDKWVGMFAEMSGAVTGLMVQTARASSSLDGEFAQAAEAAGRKFITEVTDVYTVLSTVGHRVKAAAYGAEAVKAAVPAPLSDTGGGTSTTPAVDLADLLVPGTAADTVREQTELHEQAAMIMNMNYRPTYGQAGTDVPTFVAPTQPGTLDTTYPGTGGNGGSNNNNNGGSTGGGTENPADEGATENPGTTEETTDPGTTDEDDTTAAGTDTGNSNGTNNSQGQNGSTTNPASTNPSGTSPASTALGTGGGSRGTGGGGGGSNPGGSTPGQGSPTPGKAAAGQNVAAAGGSGAGGSAAGRASGMPMMGAPGARGGGKGDDDDEHKAPDYLRGVQPELFGDDVLAVPGAIGSDAPSTRLAEQQDGSAEAS